MLIVHCLISGLTHALNLLFIYAYIIHLFYVKTK